MTEEPFISIKIGKFRFTSEKQPSHEFVSVGGYALDQNKIKERNSQSRSAFVEYVKGVVGSALELEVYK